MKCRDVRLKFEFFFSAIAKKFSSFYLKFMKIQHDSIVKGTSEGLDTMQKKTKDGSYTVVIGKELSRYVEAEKDIHEPGDVSLISSHAVAFLQLLTGTSKLPSSHPKPFGVFAQNQNRSIQLGKKKHLI